ncbi:MAG: methyltransferase domain-containing protein [Desulfobaccales bacterium]
MINTSYEPFSRQPEYIAVNRGFIESLRLQQCEHILDLACGTGTLTDLVVELYPAGYIIGLDLDMESLQLGWQHFHELGLLGDQGERALATPGTGKPQILFLQGTADCLPLQDQSVEAVVMGNSIHNLPDQDLLLREIHRALKPEGIFAFNTSFFAGTFPPGTENLYHEWLKLSLGYIQEKDAERRRQGLEGIKRKRGTSHRAFSKQWPTPAEFTQILVRNNFEVKWYCHRTIMMNQRSLETVGAYAGLACVLLSGYPVELACEALEVSARPAFETLGLTEVRRLWLEVVAVKK